MRTGRSTTAPCGCGHEGRAHEHLRRGSDCALCECRRFRLDRAAQRVSAREQRRPVTPAPRLRHALAAVLGRV